MADPIATQIPVTATPTVIPTVAQPTAQTVYSTQNIAQAATAPVTTGNAELDLYNQYMNSNDVQQAKTAVSQLQQQINQRNQALRATTTGLQYQNQNALGTTGASMNLIGTQVGRASDLASNELQALAEQQGVAQTNLQSILSDKQNQYSIIKEERNKVQNLVTQTGGKAGISLTDNYESALKKATSYLEKKDKEEKEKAKSDAEKEGLKALYREYTGSNAKPMSTKELRKKVEKLAKADKAKKNALEDLDRQIKEVSLAKSKSSGSSGSSGLTQGQKTNAIQSLLQTGANMASGGTEFVKRNAGAYGLSVADVEPFLQGNWGDGYRGAIESSTSGEVKKLMDALGVDEKTAQQLILEEAKR